MYNTARELHIGIDLGLQNINSNRKLDIEPAEKDWVLNAVMMQEINNRINPKSNTKGEGFEDTIKRIDDLESLKRDTSRLSPFLKSNNYIFNYGQEGNSQKYPNKAVYVHLPADCYRPIEVRVGVNYIGNVGTKAVPYLPINTLSTSNFLDIGYGYAMVKIAPDSDAATLYSKFKVNLGYFDGIVTNSLPLIDLEATEAYYDEVFTPTGSTYDVYGMDTMTNEDGRFMMIRMILDAVNYQTPQTGVSAYWERLGNIYRKDSIIFKINASAAKDWIINHPSGPGAPPPHAFWLIHYTDGDAGNTNDLTVPFTGFSGIASINAPGIDTAFSEDLLNTIGTTAEQTAYNALSFKEYPARIVKSSELSRLQNHAYGKTKYDSPLCVIREGQIVVYINEQFEVSYIDVEYYKRPNFISLLNNQGCEVSSDSFRMELVDKTVQKLSARINDPAYPNLARENLILE